MFPSGGYFRDLLCPYFASGLCERTHCHFRHKQKHKPDKNASVLLQLPKLAYDASPVCADSKLVYSGPSGTVTKPSSIEIDDPTIQKCDTAYEFLGSESNQSVLPKVLEYKPTPISELTSSTFHRHVETHGEYICSTPKTYATYNPTPISQLNCDTNSQLEYDPEFNYTTTTDNCRKRSRNETDSNSDDDIPSNKYQRSELLDETEGKFSDDETAATVDEDNGGDDDKDCSSFAESSLSSDKVIRSPSQANYGITVPEQESTPGFYFYVNDGTWECNKHSTTRHASDAIDESGAMESSVRKKRGNTSTGQSSSNIKSRDHTSALNQTDDSKSENQHKNIRSHKGTCTKPTKSSKQQTATSSSKTSKESSGSQNMKTSKELCGSRNSSFAAHSRNSSGCRTSHSSSSSSGAHSKNSSASNSSLSTTHSKHSSVNNSSSVVKTSPTNKKSHSSESTSRIHIKSHVIAIDNSTSNIPSIMSQNDKDPGISPSLTSSTTSTTSHAHSSRSKTSKLHSKSDSNSHSHQNNNTDSRMSGSVHGSDVSSSSSLISDSVHVSKSGSSSSRKSDSVRGSRTSSSPLKSCKLKSKSDHKNSLSKSIPPVSKEKVQINQHSCSDSQSTGVSAEKQLLANSKAKKISLNKCSPKTSSHKSKSNRSDEVVDSGHRSQIASPHRDTSHSKERKEIGHSKVRSKIQHHSSNSVQTDPHSNNELKSPSKRHIKMVNDNLFGEDSDTEPTSHARPASGLRGADKSDDDDDDVTIPSDFSDLDDVDTYEECLNIFNAFQPAETSEHLHKNRKKSPTKQPESSVALGKKRVAYEAAATTRSANVHKGKPVNVQVAQTKLSPAQVMHNRFLQLQQKAQEMRESAHTSKDEQSVSGKKRVAHSTAPTKMSSQKNSSKSAIQSKLTISTASKTEKRVAHTPAVVKLPRPTVPAEFGSKVASNIRQRYLNLIIDECVKICSTEKEAYDRGQAEEQAVYNRSTSKGIYLNLAVNAIKKLRNEAAQFTQSNTGSSKTKSPLKLSHEYVLGGAKAAKCSFTLNRSGNSTNKTIDTFTGAELYKRLWAYVLNEEQLQQNGFPRPNPDNPGGTKLYTEYSRPKAKKPNERVCIRCGRTFELLTDGRYARKEECVYHWGKAWKRKIAGVIESRYTCCQSDLQSTGCQLAKLHAHESNKYESLTGFMKTIPSSPPIDGDYGVYAMDCEMVYTFAGLELARVTVIGPDLKPVFETLVKPDMEVIDHNTRFSGLTAESMNGITTTLRDVQAVLLSLFMDKTILIGHSLESDLMAVKLMHNTVVDTSVVFPHRLGPPYKRALKTLMAEYMKRIIQDDVGGHDSLEDAVACMELMHLKVKEEARKERR